VLVRGFGSFDWGEGGVALEEVTEGRGAISRVEMILGQKFLRVARWRVVDWQGNIEDRAKETPSLPG